MIWIWNSELSRIANVVQFLFPFLTQPLLITLPHYWPTFIASALQPLSVLRLSPPFSGRARRGCRACCQHLTPITVLFFFPLISYSISNIMQTMHFFSATFWSHELFLFCFFVLIFQLCRFIYSFNSNCLLLI